MPISPIKAVPSNEYSYIGEKQYTPSYDAALNVSIDENPHNLQNEDVVAELFHKGSGDFDLSFSENGLSVDWFRRRGDRIDFRLSIGSNETGSLFVEAKAYDEYLAATIYAFHSCYGTFLSVSSEQHARNLCTNWMLENGFIDEEEYQTTCNDEYEKGIFFEIENHYDYSYSNGGSKLLSGTLLWEDDWEDTDESGDWENSFHALKGIKVDLVKRTSIRNNEIIIVNSTETDEDGRFELLDDGTGQTIRINASCGGVTVFRGIHPYRETFPASKFYSCPTIKYSMKDSNSRPNYFGRALQIAQACYYGKKYVTELSGVSPSAETVYYPGLVSSPTAAYHHIINGINLGEYLYRYWDVILHEYGHHIQTQYSLGEEAYYRHYSGGYFTEYSDFIFGNNPSKEEGMRITWGESWPTVFSLAITQKYSREIGRVRFVDDSFYDAPNNQGLPRNNSSDDHETSNSHFGEGSTGSIIAVLYDMYDGFNEKFDKVSLGHKGLWNLVTSAKATTFSQFAQYCYSAPSLAGKREEFNALLSEYGMAVSDVSIDLGQNNRYAKPKISWKKSNSNGEEDDIYSSNKYEIIFYNSLKTEILRKELLNYSRLVEYSLSDQEWNTVLHAYGTKYYFRIKCYQTNTFLTGGYETSLYECKKPKDTTKTDGYFYTSSRLVEQAVDLLPDSDLEYEITFQASSYYLFQTFGDQNTKMYIYDPKGVLVGRDDNSGYQYNAMISLYCAAGAKYRVHVVISNYNYSGKVRLHVTRNAGDSDVAERITKYEQFASFYGESIVYGCWGVQYHSCAVTYTPNHDGSFHIYLTSIFDNYLYVIDPSSGESIYSNKEYDDDSGPGTNASITKSLKAGVPYLIVYCQYNPSSSFKNLNEGDDLTLNIDVL